MDYSKEQIEAVAVVLKTVVTDVDLKLKWGALKRAEMHRAMDSGKAMDSYRYLWIQKSCYRVNEFLQTLATEFNRTWKHDRMSVADLMDICSGSYRLLKKASELDKNNKG